MRLLVDHGASLDAKDKNGWTAVRAPRQLGKREFVEFFVSKGVDLPALHLAACVGDLARVKALVEQGTNVDAKDQLGWTPFYWATCLGRTEVAKFLVAKGPAFRWWRRTPSTPLYKQPSPETANWWT